MDDHDGFPEERPRSRPPHSSSALPSILFARPDHRPAPEPTTPPAFFADLNLHHVIEAVTADKQEYDLKPFFYALLADVDAITYRHEVMRDLENPALLRPVEVFAGRLRTMREHLAQADKLYYRSQTQRWFLEAVAVYCDAVRRLRTDLDAADATSRGFLAFRAHLTQYADSAGFASLLDQTRRLQADLTAISYALFIKDNAITVRPDDADPDLSSAVEATFKKFQQGATKDYRVSFASPPDMNHVEAQILDRVALLNPEIFERLDRYCSTHAHYLDDAVALFDREVQFYVAYLQYVATLRLAGLPFCYPEIAVTEKDVHASETFDPALAYALVRERAPVVPNDFRLGGSERILVVSGPNQGGKTTFARTVGQLHYLARLGCPVPGREARLFLFDKLLTHFEREEDIKDLRGKLEDDLIRLHEVLRQATPRSLIVINEIFTSTTLSDAVALGRRMMARIIALDALCVCVTFIVELASLGDATVSMVSTVVPDDTTRRTYNVVRRPADGLAYAISIAQKYRVTYASLQERLRS